jgi:hypothetical protein
MEQNASATLVRRPTAETHRAATLGSLRSWLPGTRGRPVRGQTASPAPRYPLSIPTFVGGISRQRPAGRHTIECASPASLPAQRGDLAGSMPIAR